jgi:hypothetical protein
VTDSNFLPLACDKSRGSLTECIYKILWQVRSWSKKAFVKYLKLTDHINRKKNLRTCSNWSMISIRVMGTINGSKRRNPNHYRKRMRRWQRSKKMQVRRRHMHVRLKRLKFRDDVSACRFCKMSLISIMSSRRRRASAETNKRKRDRRLSTK